MKEITRINHLGIRVKSLKASRAFYEQLGFKFIAGPLGPERVAVMEHPAGININFILNADANTDGNLLMDTDLKPTGYTHAAIEVSHMDAILSQLESLQIPLSGGPMHHPTGTSIFIRDPDRNVIEFVEYQGLDALVNNEIANN